MTSFGSQIASHKSNNFNIMRLLLALMVIFSHSFPLALGYGDGGNEPLKAWTRQQESFGTVAVDMFFFISGFLVTASWLRSKSMQDYLTKRVLRIYPGFIVAMSFTSVLVLIVCPLFRKQVANSLYDWLVSLLQDFLFLSKSSIVDQGIFSGNPFPGMANQSLWTIPNEFSCYLIVLIIGLFCLFKKRFLIFLAALFVYLHYSISLFGGISQSEECLVSFLTGVTIWIWRDKIPFSKSIACGCLIVLLVTSQFSPWLLVVFPIMGSYCVSWLAYGPKLLLSSWADKMDISYGTYLYAFPIQQVLAMNASLRHPWIIFILATPATLSVAWLSWNLVEKRFLAMKSNTRKDFDPGIGVGCSKST
jgi:peptidoglycan/LPS O-acetylase OafA/YrhL